MGSETERHGLKTISSLGILMRRCSNLQLLPFQQRRIMKGGSKRWCSRTSLLTMLKIRKWTHSNGLYIIDVIGKRIQMLSTCILFPKLLLCIHILLKRAYYSFESWVPICPCPYTLLAIQPPPGFSHKLHTLPSSPYALQTQCSLYCFAMNCSQPLLTTLGITILIYQFIK